MSSKTSWSNEKSLALIAEVRANPVVWDVAHPDYYNKVRRADGWQAIAMEIKETADECEKKMTSLRGSYRRDKARERKTRSTGTGTDDTFTSKWFAYKAMQFLDDKALIPRNTVNSLQMTVDIDQMNDSLVGDMEYILCEQEGAHASPNSPTAEECYIATEIVHASLEDTDTSIESLVQTPTTSKQSARPQSKSRKQFKSPRKVQKRVHSRPSQIRDESVHRTHIEKALGVLEDVSRPQLKDECSTFGDFITQKLRRFDSRLRAIAQHRIHQLLFELEMVAENEVIPPGVNRDAPVSNNPFYQAYVSHSPSSEYSRSSSRATTTPPITTERSNDLTSTTGSNVKPPSMAGSAKNVTTFFSSFIRDD